ncbi:MAG: type I restriction-modification system endonuclease [Polyangiaceae bacterium]
MGACRNGCSRTCGRWECGGARGARGRTPTRCTSSGWRASSRCGFSGRSGATASSSSGPFVPPKEPGTADQGLSEELSRLQKDLDARAEEVRAAERQAEEVREAHEREARERLSAEEQAEGREDAALWEALAAEYASASERAAQSEAQIATLQALAEKLAAELTALQAEAEKAPPASIREKVERSAEASFAIALDEQATRRLIDAQLREAGWEADSEELTFQRGARPEKGVNRAIAEWPTELDGKKGRADYALFVGLLAVGVIEAKARHKDVAGVIEQAKRYSRGFLVHGVATLPQGGPFGEYKVPFLFATNGRPYLRQLKTKSGVWFLDGRRAKNVSVSLQSFHSPEGLTELLKRDVDRAEAVLATEPMPYIDREYQRRAILAVEEGLRDGRREMLVAMATGTGKTRMCIGLCYRLIKSMRFRRILFLVDRTALGKQTSDALADLRLENLKTFPEIYDVKAIGDQAPEGETRFHISTVQAMVRRILGPSQDEAKNTPVPVDLYDCIVVDECHRGYLLDREMSDRELDVRDEAEYISKYRRVLDHFDAVKIGLTATPAIHTTEIFGRPIFSYSYREAVIDGFLVDHEPPIRIVTKLARDGIHYEAKEEVLVLDRATSTLQKETLPDEVDFEIDAFNKQVITESWNRAVLGEIARHIDPEQDDKTLIFCATDEHADTVVSLFKEALAEQYGSVDDDAVVKITGEADRPLELIRRYRNERLPSVAVTVDLLTTGIDVPKISNLVFLRRVKSRVLYEQMLGRGTRLCPDIGKERFRIFDAVDLYPSLQTMTDMVPVVVNPKVPFADLALEILSSTNEEHRKASLAELVAKLQRKKRLFKGPLGEQLTSAAGRSAEELLGFLRGAPIEEIARWLDEHGAAIRLLDQATGGVRGRAIVSVHEDGVVEVSRGYGDAERPEDYLDAFAAFLRENLNHVPALLVVTQRPRALTRDDLRGLRLALDEKGSAS